MLWFEDPISHDDDYDGKEEEKEEEEEEGGICGSDEPRWKEKTKAIIMRVGRQDSRSNNEELGS